MIRRGLLDRLHRQRDLTRRLVARHPLIASTDLGARILRGLERAPTRAYPAPAQPPADAAPASISPTSDLPEPFGQATDAEPVSRLPSADSLPDAVSAMPAADPLPDLMRQMTGLPPRAPEIPPPLTSPSGDPLVDLVRRMTNQPVAAPAAPSPVSPDTRIPPTSAPAPEPVPDARLYRPLGQRITEESGTERLGESAAPGSRPSSVPPHEPTERPRGETRAPVDERLASAAETARFEIPEQAAQAPSAPSLTSGSDEQVPDLAAPAPTQSRSEKPPQVQGVTPAGQGHPALTQDAAVRMDSRDEAHAVQGPPATSDLPPVPAERRLPGDATPAVVPSEPESEPETAAPPMLPRPYGPQNQAAAAPTPELPPIDTTTPYEPASGEPSGAATQTVPDSAVPLLPDQSGPVAPAAGEPLGEARTPQAWAQHLFRSDALPEAKESKIEDGGSSIEDSGAEASLPSSEPHEDSDLEPGQSPASSLQPPTSEPGEDSDLKAGQPPASSLQPPASEPQRIPAIDLPEAGVPIRPAPIPADDSPQGWAARLFAPAQPAAQETGPIAPEPVTAQPAAAPATRPAQASVPPVPLPRITARPATPPPLPETSRRFLRPLVGIDPDSVRVHRDAQAGEVAAAFAADAVTAGADVFLAAGHAEDAPETLGLLAHELTHVARRREPRFVPPVVPQTRGSDNEETLARAVEAQTTRTARARDPLAAPAPAGTPMPDSSTTDLLAGWAKAPTTGQDTAEAAPPDQSEWGGLPAPWEPLPAWLNAPAGPATQTWPAPSATPAAANGAAPAATPAIQRAEIGRSIETATADTGTTGASTPEQAEAPEPDLDTLARQVYAILKQRLAAERRRAGM